MTDDGVDTSRQKTKRDFSQIGARFFKVDMQAFRAAAALGKNHAAAYLVLACGTGPDHRTTRWSAKAIEDRTGLKGTNAKAAIRQLADIGLLRIIKDGTRPLYELNAFHGAEPDEAWLPQAFVGTAEDTDSALRFLRRQKGVEPLSAMLDIYSRTNMDISCGMDWRSSSNPSIVFKKRRIRETEHYIVHGFSGAKWSDGIISTPVLSQLTEARQIAIVPHIVEHAGSDAEVFMPAGSWWHELDWERKIGSAFSRAGEAMLQNHEYEPIEGEVIIPFPRRYPDIELVCIVRPFLLPQTAPTLKWAEKRGEWTDAAARIGALADSFTF